MKASDIMHPEDAKALQMLRKLKGFDDFIRISMEYGYEQIFRGENLGMMVEVNANNYPSLYTAFKNVVCKVGIEEPELYIYNDPVMNAYTYGETNTFIALSNSLVERLNLDETSSVIAHECGHILCKHTLYNTLLRTIEELGLLFQILSYSTLGPILMAMQYWSRKSELSADRCSRFRRSTGSAQNAWMCGAKMSRPGCFRRKKKSGRRSADGNNRLTPRRQTA